MDDETRYAALVARDRRFDGVFFVAVSTTGVYCRPICPARTPGRTRCHFYVRAAEAERDGYRACFRCRPERAPGDASVVAAVDARARLVQRAVTHIDSGALGEGSLEGLAAELGVTSRHLRRSMEAELGVSPLAWAQTRRLALAKQLLQDTRVPVTEVALASGFGSVRRFNAAFLERFGRAPSTLRSERVGPGADAEVMTLRLDYRPPLDWAALLRFIAARALPGIEAVEGQTYVREVRLGPHRGRVRVSEQEPGAPLHAEIAVSLAPVLMPLVARLRRLLDLDAHPLAIAEHLSRDRRLRPLVQAHPGLRVPGAFDGYEIAVRALLGQQVSVAAATTLAGRLIARCGGELPAPEALAAMPVEAVAAIGLPRARAAALITLATAIAGGEVVLEPGVDPLTTQAALEALPGIGPWTSSYLLMRAIGWPDAFPAGDLVLRNTLGLKTAREVTARAESWRPWRAYAALHLWMSA